MDGQQARAFGFEGTWKDYAPIAFTNLLLTIVTLGIYRFWATTRTRRYLWSRTRFIDEHLEWAGTGMELFIGFLLVLVLMGLPFLFLNFGLSALVLQGHGVLAGVLAVLSFIWIFYLSGVAMFRMVRYRLSRTWWHGIRGGSNDRGWRYGWTYMWKTIAGSAAFGLLIPWAMVSLWNERWSKMSFGPYGFTATANESAVFKRFLLFYLLPIVLVVVGGIVGFAGAMFAAAGVSVEPGEGMTLVALLVVVLMVVLIYGAMGLVALAYYSKFFRVVVSGLSLEGLEFRFDARAKDWVKLILGDIGLVIVTLGVGMIFLSYRHWKFFVTHLDAGGEISLSELTQSTTAAPGQGEGLADAFDMGAI